MAAPKNGRIARTIFDVAVVVKGIDGAIEIVAGTLLFFVRPKDLRRIAELLTIHELTKDPHDLLVRFVLPALERLSSGELSFRTFGAIYLLVHGAIKVALVTGLLLKRSAAYPVAIAAFILFLVYQMSRYAHTHSRALLVLALLDIPVIVLTVLEYRRLRASERAHAGSREANDERS